ncbi:GNAT family N-acetyltransferase [Saccharibacillus sp. O23]|uniref:GNAT family N-acetyltransferase n=1 Tax=Saccharibacillus sp. O23 TaxID=2009338 RepID=UPI0015C5B36A|nr:GNAT family N-acetyltransferase [Saccharibacillus sp. O23]
MDSDRISEQEPLIDVTNPEKLPKELLKRGDTLEWRVEAYLHEAEWLLIEDRDGEAAAVLGCLRTGAEEAEIVNAAVREWNEEGKARLLRLVSVLRGKLQDRGVRRLIAYAGNWETELLAAYQRSGFRIIAAESDYYADCWAQQSRPGEMLRADRLMLELLWTGLGSSRAASDARTDSAPAPVIRRVELRDSRALLAMKKQLDRETTSMLFEPGERRMTDGDQLEQIRVLLRSPNSLLWVAESEDRIVGYLEATGGKVRRNQHTVYVVIGILETHTGHGLGRRLFDQLFEWATRRQILRAELTVQAPNQRAYRLYRSVGFKLEGIMRGALMVEGEPVDLYQMGCDMRTIGRSRVDK